MIRIIKNLRAYWRIARIPHGAAWMKIVERVMKFAEEAQQKKQPMMTKIAAIDMTGESPMGSFDVVSLWAGQGDGNPLERIRHLKERISGMKEVLKAAKEYIPETEENKTLHANIFLALEYM